MDHLFKKYAMDLGPD